MEYGSSKRRKGSCSLRANVSSHWAWCCVDICSFNSHTYHERWKLLSTFHTFKNLRLKGIELFCYIIIPIVQKISRPRKTVTCQKSVTYIESARGWIWTWFSWSQDRSLYLYAVLLSVLEAIEGAFHPAWMTLCWVLEGVIIELVLKVGKMLVTGEEGKDQVKSLTKAKACTQERTGFIQGTQEDVEWDEAGWIIGTLEFPVGLYGGWVQALE